MQVGKSKADRKASQIERRANRPATQAARILEKNVRRTAKREAAQARESIKKLAASPEAIWKVNRDYECQCIAREMEKRREKSCQPQQ
jgi:hypothetical protein